VKSEFRQRVFLPVVLPLVVLLAIAAFIGAIALTLLYNTHEGALMLAAVAAGGILFTVSLASSQDRLGGARRAVVVFAAMLPLVVGAGIGVGVIGGVADEDRNINTEPLLVVPDDAPVIAAENALEFCLPEDGECVPTEAWTIPATGPDPTFVVFDNRDVGVPHNFSVYELAGTEDAPEGGDPIHLGQIDSGPVELIEVIEPALEPGDYFFVCDVHPFDMIGVLTVSEDGDAEAA
jgi:hypothetical protein